MDLHADAVAETVAEMLALAALLDHLPRDSVNLAPAGAAEQGRKPSLLGAQHELVDLTGLVSDRLAGRERPRAVRAVAVAQRAPVDRDQDVRRDLLVPRLGV